MFWERRLGEVITGAASFLTLHPPSGAVTRVLIKTRRESISYLFDAVPWSESIDTDYGHADMEGRENEGKLASSGHLQPTTA